MRSCLDKTPGGRCWPSLEQPYSGYTDRPLDIADHLDERILELTKKSREKANTKLLRTTANDRQVDQIRMTRRASRLGIRYDLRSKCRNRQNDA